MSDTTTTTTTATANIETCYSVSPDLYRGCGRAWAAIDGDAVVGLLYMGNHALDRNKLPLWVQAIKDNAEGLDHRMLPTAHSSRGLSRLAAAARSCTDCPRSPRGLDIRPNRLLQMAVSIIEKEDVLSFLAYRQACREELAKIGIVVSGDCSCTVFYVSMKHCGLFKS